MLEAKTAASIRHANIVSIYGFGFHDDQPYIAMEFLDGLDFEELLKNHGPLPFARVHPLFLKALDALGAVHKKGIVHKDLKPANLFIVAPNTPHEDLRVLDFGVARIMEDDQKMTGTGQLFGTPNYLAPEYVQGKDVTPAVDVYQMGLILLELLTGHVAVEGTNPYATALAHCGGQVPIPTRLLHSPIGPILTQAISTDPAGRYPNAAAFHAALATVPTHLIPHLEPREPSALLCTVSGSLAAVTLASGPLSGPLSGPHSGPVSGPLSGPLSGPVSGPLSGPQTLPWQPLNAPPSHPIGLAAPTIALTRPSRKTADPTLDADASRPRLLLLAVGALLILFLLLTAATVALVVSNDLANPAPGAATAPPTPPADTRITTAAPTPEPNPPKPTQPTSEPPATPATPAPPAKVVLTFESAPTGADLYLAGKSIGRTPLRWEVDPANKDLKVRFSKPGYLPRDVLVGQTADETFVVDLDPAPIIKPRTAPPTQPPRTPTPTAQPATRPKTPTPIIIDTGPRK